MKIIISKFYFWRFLTQHWTIYSEERAAVWGLWCPGREVGLFPYLHCGLWDTWIPESARASLHFKSPWFTWYLCRSYFSNNYVLEICYCYFCLEGKEVLVVLWNSSCCLQLFKCWKVFCFGMFWDLSPWVYLSIWGCCASSGMGDLWNKLGFLEDVGFVLGTVIQRLNLCPLDASSECVFSYCCKHTVDSSVKVKITSCKCFTTLLIKGFKTCMWCYFHDTYCLFKAPINVFLNIHII